MDDRLSRSVPWWREAGVALAVAVIVILGTTHISPGPDERSVDGVAYACGLVAAGGLGLSRRRPVLATTIVGAAILVYISRQYPGGPVLMPGPLVLVGLGGSRRAAPHGWAQPA